MKERDNILRILEGTRDGMLKGDFSGIKDLSNQTINTAARTHDLDNIAVAVVVYSIAKILERENYKHEKGWSTFYKMIEKSINNAIKDIDDENKFRKDLERIRWAMGRLSGNLKKYVQDVFKKAEINKASRIYEHGTSMEKTASSLGITMYELANYVGQKGSVEDKESKTFDIKYRVKIVEDLFG